MSIEFNCFSKVTILKPDGNPFAGVYSSFSYIDLSSYGGSSFVSVTSNEEVIAEFLNLGVTVKFEGFSIVIQNTNITSNNIPSVLNQEIKFTDGLSVDTCITNQNRFDLTFYGGNSVEFLYTIEDIKARLETLTGATVTVTTCGATFDQYTDPVADITITADPVINYTFNLSTVNFDPTIYNGVDLSPYGGTLIITSSLAEIVTAFGTLGITATATASNITLNEYLGTVSNIELCAIDTFNINELDFDKVLFPVIYGGTQTMSTPSQVAAHLTNYNISVSYANIIGGYEFTVTSPLCTDIQDLPTSLFNVIEANNDIITLCILTGTTYSYNLLANDSNIDSETITHINGQAVIEGSIVNINSGLDIQYISNGNVDILTDGVYVSNLTDEVSYSIINGDSQTASAFFQFCIADTPVANPDLITMACNTNSGVLTVLANDFTAYNDLTITHINNTPVTTAVDLIIFPGFTVINIDTAVGFELSPSDDFEGTGTLSYTVTNGAFTAVGTVDYTVTGCDPCITNNISFPTTYDCASLCWTTLIANGSPVLNYILQFLDSNNNPVENAVGDIIKVANGTFFDATTTLPPDTCIPFRAGDYTVEIIDSDVGSNFICDSLGFTMLPVACDGIPCVFGYSGAGGVASSLQFDIEVGATATITIVDFDPKAIPDGLVIEYNGNVLYHTGLSAVMPYITSTLGGTTFICNGITYTSEYSLDITNLEISVPYVAGVDTALVSIYGNQCKPTVWDLTIKCEL